MMSPAWPPEVIMTKSSYLPGGTKVLSAASASSGVSPRCWMISSSAPPPTAASLGLTGLSRGRRSRKAAPASTAAVTSSRMVFMRPAESNLRTGAALGEFVLAFSFVGSQTADRARLAKGPAAIQSETDETGDVRVSLRAGRAAVPRLPPRAARAGAPTLLAGGRREPGDAGAHAEGDAHCYERRPGDHLRRERGRQGGPRARTARQQPAAGPALPRGQRRRPAGRSPRIGALRPHQGGVHRRGCRQAGPLSGGRRRHAAPRRDRRDAAGAAGEALARARGRRGPSGGR